MNCPEPALNLEHDGEALLPFFPDISRCKQESDADPEDPIFVWFTNLYLDYAKMLRGL